MIPASLGAGEHWRLNDDEASQMGRALKEALDTIPDSATGKVAKIMGTWAPWIGLGWVGFTVTAPRMLETRLIMSAGAGTLPGAAGGENT